MTRTPKQAFLIGALWSLLAVMGWLGLLLGDFDGLSLFLAIGWTLLAAMYVGSGISHRQRLRSLMVYSRSFHED
jgi:hypothetical protein